MVRHVSHSERNFRVEVHDVVADDEHAVGLNAQLAGSPSST